MLLRLVPFLSDPLAVKSSAPGSLCFLLLWLIRKRCKSLLRNSMCVVNGAQSAVCRCLADMSSLCSQAPSDHAAAEGPPGATVPFYDPAHFTQVSALATAQGWAGRRPVPWPAALPRCSGPTSDVRPWPPGPAARVLRPACPWPLPFLPVPGVEDRVGARPAGGLGVQSGSPPSLTLAVPMQTLPPYSRGPLTPAASSGTCS